ncbi:hypothetical protein [Miltoncostaea oceani]|uniref:hypothetical protein n=1 Tax=Miltoncostaea oceani TaxID=2843216 RepID=UPI001C3DFE0D|nr:hypothetical protein [Miltoncostaea oceani]
MEGTDSLLHGAGVNDDDLEAARTLLDVLPWIGLCGGDSEETGLAKFEVLPSDPLNGAGGLLKDPRGAAGRLAEMSARMQFRVDLEREFPPHRSKLELRRFEDLRGVGHALRYAMRRTAGEDVDERVVAVHAASETLIDFARRNANREGFSGVQVVHGPGPGDKGGHIWITAAVDCLMDGIPTRVEVRAGPILCLGDERAGLIDVLDRFDALDLICEPSESLANLGPAGLRVAHLGQRLLPRDVEVRESASVDQLTGPDVCDHRDHRWLTGVSEVALACDSCLTMSVRIPLHQLPDGHPDLAGMNQEKYMAERHARGALLDDEVLKRETREGLTFEDLRRRDPVIVADARAHERRPPREEYAGAGSVRDLLRGRSRAGASAHR